MALTWSQIVEVTHDDAKQDILNTLDTFGFAATSWQEGAFGLHCVEVGAWLYSKASTFAVFLKSMGLNETAAGEALTRFSVSHYDNERNDAIATQARVTLSCSATEGPHSIGLGDVVLTDTDGHTFRNIEGNSVSYPATLTSGGNVTLLFEAEVAGGDSNIAEGAALSLVTTLAGVTASGFTKTRVGSDEESDVAIRLRNSSRWGQLAEFELIRDRVENIARNAHESIVHVGVDDQNPRGPGTFDVYIAAATATSGPTEIIAAQDAFDARVFGSETCLVQAAPAVALNITGIAYHDNHYTSAAVSAAITDALLAFIETIPLGGFDYSPGPANFVPKNDIEAVIKNTEIDGVKVVKTVTLSSPAGDVPVSAFGKVTQGTWTITLSAVTSGQ